MTVTQSVCLKMSIVQLQVQSRRMPYTHSLVIIINQYLCHNLRQHPIVFCWAAWTETTVFPLLQLQEGYGVVWNEPSRRSRDSAPPSERVWTMELWM